MNDKEKLVNDLAQSIQKHRQKELDIFATNPAIGFANVLLLDEFRKFWLTNKPNLGGYKIVADLHGNIETAPSFQTTVTEDGNPIYKNSPFGECIIRNSSGKHIVKVDVGEREIEIYNTSFYTPHPSLAEAIDIRMNIGEPKPRFFRSIMEILGQIKRESEEIEKIERQLVDENNKDVENKELINRLELLKKSNEETLSKAKSFIRKNYELRYQPILDPWQEEVKRSNLFNSTIAIDGGPGTGKTTSLIQRIKFLTDQEAMKDYVPNLTKDQTDKLFNNEHGWIFFSPNELLKLFLKNSMVMEGLAADDNHVKIWDSQREQLIKRYKLTNTETQNPFLFLKKFKDQNILPSNGKDLKVILDSFDKYYLSFQNDRLSKLLLIDCNPFFWKNKGVSIQKYINRQEKDYSFEGLIRLFNNLQETFTIELNQLVSDYNDVLKNEAARVQRSIESNDSVKDQVFLIIDNWLEENRNDDEDDENLDETIEEDEELETNKELFLFNKIKTIIRKNSLAQYDKNVKLTKRENQLKIEIDKSIELINLNDFDKIGQLAYFIKYFGRVTKGFVNNLFLDIPKLYKSFRRKELEYKKNKWNYEILESLVLSDEQKNKRLHGNEQALLLLFINDFIKKAYKVSKLKTKVITHSYFEAYNENSRCVIAVDEATDFHIIDLLAIQSLSDYEISSVTYSGDLMQRLTIEGIKDWKELKLFLSKFEVKELIISYRQSPTLLKIAQSIYNEATGKKAEYLSFMDEDNLEPKPLFFESDKESNKLEWISKRILEIYNAYGNTIPSIAIFLSNENEIEPFAQNLGDLDRLSDIGIQVLACNQGRVLGDNNTVRVFSVDFIKGLEFEAVFYHNINEIFTGNNSDLVMKNLYVGLSRASFYLGITTSNDLEKLPFIKEYFINEKEDWK